MTNKKHTSFKQFYPFYLSEHSNKTCRLLHVIGTTLVVFLILYCILTWHYQLMLLAPIIGYGFAWIGHYFFEKNTPATFKYPLYSFIGDWVMWWQTITFRKL